MAASDETRPEQNRRRPGGDHSDGPGLTRDQIVERATELVAAEGLEALTMKTVAESFGVTPMALYWHVSSKAELVQLVVASVIDPVSEVEPTGDFAEATRTLTTALYERLRSYPGVANELMATQRYPMSLTKVIERGMQTMIDAGFSPQEAAFRVNLLAFFTLSRGGVAAASELGVRTGAGSARDRAITQTSENLGDTPVGPLLAEYFTYWLGTNEDELFHRGLDVLITGMLHELQSE